jgi:hypothetical protein
LSNTNNEELFDGPVPLQSDKDCFLKIPKLISSIEQDLNVSARLIIYSLLLEAGVAAYGLYFSTWLDTTIKVVVVSVLAGVQGGGALMIANTLKHLKISFEKDINLIAQATRHGAVDFLEGEEILKIIRNNNKRVTSFLLRRIIMHATRKGGYEFDL